MAFSLRCSIFPLLLLLLLVVAVSGGSGEKSSGGHSASNSGGNSGSNSGGSGSGSNSARGSGSGGSSSGSGSGSVEEPQVKSKCEGLEKKFTNKCLVDDAMCSRMQRHLRKFECIPNCTDKKRGWGFECRRECPAGTVVPGLCHQGLTCCQIPR